MRVLELDVMSMPSGADRCSLSACATSLTHLLVLVNTHYEFL